MAKKIKDENIKPVEEVVVEKVEEPKVEPKVTLGRAKTEKKAFSEKGKHLALTLGKRRYSNYREFSQAFRCGSRSFEDCDALWELLKSCKSQEEFLKNF